MPLRSGNGERRRELAPAPSGTAADRVSVGRILRAHGIRGELKVEVWSDVEGRFARGAEMYLNVHGRYRKVRIEQVRPERGNLLVRLEGIATREQAEELRNARLEVDVDEVPEAPEGFYYHFQLEGCVCRDETAGLLGEVVEVVEDGGGTLLRVEKDGRSVLLPFVDDFLQGVDIAGKRIDFRLPEGLLDICTSKS